MTQKKSKSRKRLTRKRVEAATLKASFVMDVDELINAKLKPFLDNFEDVYDEVEVLRDFVADLTALKPWVKASMKFWRKHKNQYPPPEVPPDLLDFVKHEDPNYVSNWMEYDESSLKLFRVWWYLLDAVVPPGYHVDREEDECIMDELFPGQGPGYGGFYILPDQPSTPTVEDGASS